ncbi:MAG: hypothetical protein JKY42_08415 [Flavobacteriales bacterium]|nr:hypothetical protein [Flavobacteriales bacterium]
MNEVVSRVKEILDNITDPNIKEPTGGWSAIQVLGHLLDSASNNHHRFVGYVAGQTFAAPGYNQDLSVERAHYQELEFSFLSSLWYNYNILTDHVVNNISEEEMPSLVKVGNSDEVTLEFLIADYYDHMKTHEKQLIRMTHAHG